MSVGNFFKVASVVVGVTCMGAVAAYAADAPAPASAAQAQQMQVAALADDAAAAPAASQTAQPRMGDGLHSDPRWPHFASCISNTASRAQFEACLRNAFMADGTGVEASLVK